MRITLLAVGKMKAGPEKDLFDNYLIRLKAIARPLGVTDVRLVEVEDRKGRDRPGQQDREGEKLLAAVPSTAQLMALDEHGKALPSKALADLLQSLLDQGVGEWTLAIGGADGHSPALLKRADRKLALGPQTWPHMLVRVMLAEQLYRAASILTGHPYHRA